MRISETSFSRALSLVIVARRTTLPAYASADAVSVGREHSAKPPLPRRAPRRNGRADDVSTSTSGIGGSAAVADADEAVDADAEAAVTALAAGCCAVRTAEAICASGAGSRKAAKSSRGGRRGGKANKRSHGAQLENRGLDAPPRACTGGGVRLRRASGSRKGVDARASRLKTPVTSRALCVLEPKRQE